MKILNFGSLNIDYVYKVESFVRAGETISAARLDKNVGGKGLNQSVALARSIAEAGQPEASKDTPVIYHAGCIGRDGMMLKDFLSSNDVNTELIRITDEPTGHAVIQVDASGQNCIIIYGGANICITEEYADSVLRNFGEGDVLLMQNEINLIPYIMKKAHENKMTVVFNPSPITGELKNVPLELVDYLILNETEGGAITGEAGYANIRRELARLYPATKFILTLGGDGADYFDREKHIHADAFKVRAVDTTAAGDTFTGYFITSVMSGKPESEALAIASKAASVSITKNGAACSIPRMYEIDN